MEKLILIGAGGFAKSVLDSVDYFNYEMIGFIDEFAAKKRHLGYPVIARSLDEIKDKKEYFYFVCIGDNHHRRRWYDRIVQDELRIINVVDPSAMVSKNATIGTGCFIGKMSIVNSGVSIGNNCIINTKSLVEHGCRISDYANISTNSVLNGDVSVGIGSFVGSSSVTIGQRHIGNWATVGAGAVVIRDVPDGMIYAGIPAKKVSTLGK